MSISGISPVDIKGLPSIPKINVSGEDTSTKKTSFSDYLKDAVDNTVQLQQESAQMSNDLVTGKIDDLHSVTIAGQKAELALQFTLQIRNKLLDAYNEIMRIQI